MRFNNTISWSLGICLILWCNLTLHTASAEYNVTHPPGYDNNIFVIFKQEISRLPWRYVQGEYFSCLTDINRLEVNCETQEEIKKLTLLHAQGWETPTNFFCHALLSSNDSCFRPWYGSIWIYKSTSSEVARCLRSFPTMFEFHAMLKHMCVTPCSVATRHCALRDYYVADLWLAVVCTNYTILCYT